MKTHTCEKCWFRSYAERKPRSILGRLWRWHTGWCPGWKAYQKALAADHPQAELPNTADHTNNPD
jgi:hypothetical protein